MSQGSTTTCGDAQVGGKFAAELLLRALGDAPPELGADQRVRVRGQMERADARVRLAATHALIEPCDGSSVKVVLAASDTDRDLGE